MSSVYCVKTRPSIIVLAVSHTCASTLGDIIAHITYHQQNTYNHQIKNGLTFDVDIDKLFLGLSYRNMAINSLTSASLDTPEETLHNSFIYNVCMMI